MKTVEQQHAAPLASESESQDAQIQNVSFQRGLFLFLLEAASLSLVQSAQLTLNSQWVATGTDGVVMVALRACPSMLG